MPELVGVQLLQDQATAVYYKASELLWNKFLLQEALSDPHLFRTQGHLLPFHLRALHLFLTSLSVTLPGTRVSGRSRVIWTQLMAGEPSLDAGEITSWAGASRGSGSL